MFNVVIVLFVPELINIKPIFIHFNINNFKFINYYDNYADYYWLFLKIYDIDLLDLNKFIKINYLYYMCITDFWEFYFLNSLEYNFGYTLSNWKHYKLTINKPDKPTRYEMHVKPKISLLLSYKFDYTLMFFNNKTYYWIPAPKQFGTHWGPRKFMIKETFRNFYLFKINYSSCINTHGNVVFNYKNYMLRDYYHLLGRFDDGFEFKHILFNKKYFNYVSSYNNYNLNKSFSNFIKSSYVFNGWEIYDHSPATYTNSCNFVKWDFARQYKIWLILWSFYPEQYKIKDNFDYNEMYTSLFKSFNNINYLDLLCLSIFNGLSTPNSDPNMGYVLNFTNEIYLRNLCGCIDFNLKNYWSNRWKFNFKTNLNFNIKYLYLINDLEFFIFNGKDFFKLKFMKISKIIVFFEKFTKIKEYRFLYSLNTTFIFSVKKFYIFATKKKFNLDLAYHWVSSKLNYNDWIKFKKVCFETFKFKKKHRKKYWGIRTARKMHRSKKLFFRYFFLRKIIGRLRPRRIIRYFKRMLLRSMFKVICKKFNYKILFNVTSNNINFLNIVNLYSYASQNRTNNYVIFFLRKQKIFNKGRYSRNRQLYRTGVYMCIWINIIMLYTLYFLFYGLTPNFSYVFTPFIMFLFLPIFLKIIKYNLFSISFFLTEIKVSFFWFFNVIRLLLKFFVDNIFIKTFYIYWTKYQWVDCRTDYERLSFQDLHNPNIYWCEVIERKYSKFPEYGNTHTDDDHYIDPYNTCGSRGVLLAGTDFSYYNTVRCNFTDYMPRDTLLSMFILEDGHKAFFDIRRICSWFKRFYFWIFIEFWLNFRVKYMLLKRYPTTRLAHMHRWLYVI